MRQSVLQLLANPDIAFLLTMLGGTGIVWECAAPGWVLPGVLGLILTTLGLAALTTAASAGWTALLLAVGLSLLAAEAKFRPRGIAAVTGILMMTIGAHLSGVTWISALAAVVPFAWISLRLWTISIQAKANKRLSTALRKHAGSVDL